MAEYGMTPEGFVPKRLADILESITTKVKNIQDPTTGEYPFMNESADSIFGQFAQIIAEELSICWEQAYQSSVQFDPLSARGSALRSLVQLNGITPSYGAKTELLMTLGGTSGTVIPEGSLISNQAGTEQYATVASVTIPNTGEVTVNAVCTEAGPNNPDQNTIIQIQTPVAGWSSATNTSTVAVGDNADTDEELHIKQQRATSATSYRQVDAIISGIMNVDGVKFARLYVNKTTSTDSRGIAGKTLAPVIVGGTDEDIANVLRLKIGATDNTQGNLTNPVVYTGELGDTQTIDFYRPTEVPIYIEIDVTVTDGNLWNIDSTDKIKQAIIDYAEYDQSGAYGFPPGGDVLLSRLYTPINSVPGFSVTSLTIGKSAGSLDSSDIAIDWNEIATFDADNITINVTVPE